MISLSQHKTVASNPHHARAYLFAQATGINAARLLQIWADIFIVLGFTVFLGGGIQLLIMLRGAEGFSNLEGDLPSQIIYFSVYLVSTFFLVLSKRRIMLGLAGNFWFWFLLFWTCLSILWSYAPWVTMRHIIALCGTTLFSVYVVNHVGIQKYVKLLGISLLLITLSSYFVIAFLPEIGIGHVVTSEWKGIFTHKNHLGKAASLSVLIFFYMFLTARKGKWGWFVALLGAAGLLAGCQSAAATIISMSTIIVMGVFHLTRKTPFLVWIMLLSSLIAFFLFQLFFPVPSGGQILRYFGKDETLTGRTQLWDFSIHMALRKTWLGYGYGAFWLGSKGPSAEAWAGMRMGMDITHSHNGFIEIALGVGGVGLFLSLAAYLRGIWRAIQFQSAKNSSFDYAIYLFLLLWILPYNFTEQAFLYRNNIFWVLFSSVVLYQIRDRSVRNELDT
jgi:exopolysaccharide production protein ExoQ